jgi:hypothetical protein
LRGGGARARARAHGRTPLAGTRARLRALGAEPSRPPTPTHAPLPAPQALPIRNYNPDQVSVTLTPISRAGGRRRRLQDEGGGALAETVVGFEVTIRMNASDGAAASARVRAAPAAPLFLPPHPSLAAPRAPVAGAAPGPEFSAPVCTMPPPIKPPFLRTHALLPPAEGVTTSDLGSALQSDGFKTELVTQIVNTPTEDWGIKVKEGK